MLNVENWWWEAGAGKGHATATIQVSVVGLGERSYLLRVEVDRDFNRDRERRWHAVRIPYHFDEKVPHAEGYGERRWGAVSNLLKSMEV